MGCSGSKQSTQATATTTADANKAEADRWERRKANGFKDSGLYRNIDAMEKQKKNLRHVQDPEVARREKKQKIQAKNKKEAKIGGGGKNATGGMNEAELQNARKKLKHRR